MSSRLDEAQVAFFKKNGYLIFDRPVFSDDKFQRLRDHFQVKQTQWEKTGKAPEHMDVPHFTDTALYEWLFAPEVMGLISPLCGPDIALWSSHFLCKPASTGKRVPWHEDSAYWGTTVDPMEVLTVWLAIDRSTPENGCLRVIPGTHNNGYSEYDPVNNPTAHVFDSEIRRNRIDESRAVDIVLEPNQCSIHHCKLIHGSNFNTSTSRRCGYTMRYFPTTSRFHPERRKNRQTLHQVYLASGQDHAGNVYGDHTKVHDAWANASVQERNLEKALSH
jgi:chlorinating enzyme